MFMTRTEIRKAIERLPERYYKITYAIEERRTGQRAAVEVAGTPNELLTQMNAVYDDGFAVATNALGGPRILDFGRRNTTKRIALGANRTSYGY